MPFPRLSSPLLCLINDDLNVLVFDEQCGFEFHRSAQFRFNGNCHMTQAPFHSLNRLFIYKQSPTPRNQNKAAKFTDKHLSRHQQNTISTSILAQPPNYNFSISCSTAWWQWQCEKSVRIWSRHSRNSMNKLNAIRRTQRPFVLQDALSAKWDASATDGKDETTRTEMFKTCPGVFNGSVGLTVVWRWSTSTSGDFQKLRVRRECCGVGVDCFSKRHAITA